MRVGGGGGGGVTNVTDRIELGKLGKSAGMPQALTFNFWVQDTRGPVESERAAAGFRWQRDGV